MSGCTYIEKQKLERELGVRGGHVLGFSNRTFGDFFREVVGVDMPAAKYDFGTGLKARRMRASWQVASDQELRRLIKGLFEGWDVHAAEPITDTARTLLIQSARRLRENSLPSDTQQPDEKRSIDQTTAEKLGSPLICLTCISPQQQDISLNIPEGTV